MDIHLRGLLNFGKDPISRQPAQLTVYAQNCQYRIYESIKSDQRSIPQLTPASMVKHRTAYYPHGYADRMNNQKGE